MATSGVATTERSVTIGWLAWAEIPTPPPIAIPSMTATTGLG